MLLQRPPEDGRCTRFLIVQMHDFKDADYLPALALRSSNESF